MTAAIIVHIITSDTSPLALMDLAKDVADACERAGLEVESATPWARPSAQTVAQPGLNPTQPPNSPPTLF